jgi:hypothetical protein
LFLSLRQAILRQLIDWSGGMGAMPPPQGLRPYNPVKKTSL